MICVKILILINRFIIDFIIFIFFNWVKLLKLILIFTICIRSFFICIICWWFRIGILIDWYSCTFWLIKGNILGGVVILLEGYFYLFFLVFIWFVGGLFWVMFYVWFILIYLILFYLWDNIFLFFIKLLINFWCFLYFLLLIFLF